MRKKPCDEQLTALGCLAGGVIALIPGTLFFVAVTYQIQWLVYAITIPMLIIAFLFFLAVLTPYSKRLKEVCNTLLFLYGIGFLIDFLLWQQEIKQNFSDTQKSRISKKGCGFFVLWDNLDQKPIFPSR